MRIAMIGQKGIPARSGGVERHVEDLATRLASAGHEVFAYCRKFYVAPRATERFEGVQCVMLPTLRSKHLETPIHTLAATLHALVVIRPDIFHFHGIGPSIWAWIPRIFAPRAKVLATFHCQDYFHKKWGALARLVFRLGEIFACTTTHETIVVSRTLAAYVRERYGRVATYIPNAVALPSPRPAQAIQHFGLEKDSYILSVSRLVPHKGIHTIIDAYNRACARSGSLPKLAIVGAQSYTDGYVADLKQRAAGNDRILFLGEQSGEALAALYSNARLFVHASESEGLSYTLLEAMSYGTPVIASDISENIEALPHDSITFPSGDVDGLSAAMEAALSLPHRELASASAEHIKKHYDADRVFPQTLALYGRLQAA